MRYRLLGRSGMRVSEACLGTMNFGEDWGWGADRATSLAVFEAFAEAGGNFVDTADLYQDGTSERIVGEGIRADRDHFVVGTKYSSSDGQDLLNSGNSRKQMHRALEGSLRRLGTDYVDLFWLHIWDGTTPLEEILRGLDDLVRSGKVRYVGISNTPAWIVSRANAIADLRGWSPFVALQIEYSLAERTPERDLLPMCAALDLAVTPWAPLAGGVLSGKYAPGTERSSRGGRLHPDRVALAQRITELARSSGLTTAQLSLAWLASRPGVVLPIVGASSTEQLRENLRAFESPVPVAVLEALDEATAVTLGAPHAFLGSPGVRARVTAEPSTGTLSVHRPLVGIPGLPAEPSPR